MPSAHVTTFTEVRAPGTLTRRVAMVARVLLGLLFVFAGGSWFLGLVPPPTEPIPEGAAALGSAFAASGYLMQLIKGTELVCGLLLVSNRLVPLALVLLAPVAVNIVAFHAFLARDGLPMAVVIAVLLAGLAWAYRGAFRSMLRVRVAPGV